MSQQSDDYPFQLIGQDMFDMCTEAWHKALGAGKPLTQYFNCGNEPQQWLNYVYFSVADILYLLSSVGTHHINLRFALIPTSPNGGVRFSVILYGTDKAGAKTSSYFRAAIPAEGAPLVINNGPNNSVDLAAVAEAKEPAAYPLAAAWINNWNVLINNSPALDAPANPVEVTAAMFDSAFGPLRGYTYPLKDLLLAVNPLLNAGDYNVQFRFVFGLHHYLKPENMDMQDFDELFAMVIHIAPAGSSLQLSNESTYYDISEPCPPYCH